MLFIGEGLRGVEGVEPLASSPCRGRAKRGPKG